MYISKTNKGDFMLRKTVIITGGFGGIGGSIAETFAQNGYNIALTYNHFFDTNFIKKLKCYDVEVFAMKCDQTKENDIINFVNSAFNEFEYIDAFIACAGLAETPIELINKPTEMIDEIISVNFRGTILFNREILRHFVSQKHGNIVNISSIYGNSGACLESVYAACKAGIINLTKSLAKESAPYIRINCIAPGCIDTKMIATLDQTDRETIISQTPLARLGTPEDIANIAYFLCNSQSSFITGETVYVTGGVDQFN